MIDVPTALIRFIHVYISLIFIKTYYKQIKFKQKFAKTQKMTVSRLCIIRLNRVFYLFALRIFTFYVISFI